VEERGKRKGGGETGEEESGEMGGEDGRNRERKVKGDEERTEEGEIWWGGRECREDKNGQKCSNFLLNVLIDRDSTYKT